MSSFEIFRVGVLFMPSVVLRSAEELKAPVTPFSIERRDQAFMILSFRVPYMPSEMFWSRERLVTVANRADMTDPCPLPRVSLHSLTDGTCIGGDCGVGGRSSREVG